MDKKDAVCICSEILFSHKNIIQPVSNNTREDCTHGHHLMVNTKIRLIIFIVAKDGEADCGSDYELIAKFRLILKKVGKTT